MPVFSVRGSINSQGGFEIGPEDLHHLTRVLRLKSGDKFEVLLPDGRKGEARLEGEENHLSGKILQLGAANPERILPLWLGVGMIRWSRLEWLVEKATELGVHRISPLHLSQGRLPKGESISNNKIERLNKISQETLKQCERSAAPVIDAPLSLEDFLQKVGFVSGPGVEKFMFRERYHGASLNDRLFSASTSWVFLVGPEGGFSEAEIALAESRDFESVSLGPTVLRSETAAIYACSALDMVMAKAGRLG